MATATTPDITAPDISFLSAACTDVRSVPFDCTEGLGADWEYTQADECSGCGAKLLVCYGEERHRDIEEASSCEGYVSGDGPMFNYLYPLSECPSDDTIKQALADLPLCVASVSTAAAHIA